MLSGVSEWEKSDNARDKGNIADMLQMNGRKELWKALILRLIYCDSLLTFPTRNKLRFIGVCVLSAAEKFVVK